jgi:hypothetical protein
MEVEWDLKANGEFAKLLVAYEKSSIDGTVTIYSVIQDGLEWIDYLNGRTRAYLIKYISERLYK